MRQIVQNKADEDVVGVVRRRLRIGHFQGFLHFTTNRVDLSLRPQCGGGCGINHRRRNAIRAQPPGHAPPPAFARRRDHNEPAKQPVCPPDSPCDGAFVGRLIEKDRRLFKLEENENHHPGEENEELHRQFEHGIEKQPEATADERSAGKIALHLRLVGPEIGEREEKAAEQTRPKGVASLEIKGEIDRVQLSHPSRNRNSLEKRESAGKRWRIMPKATAIPARMTTICHFCVWLTAVVPPGGRIDDDEKSRKQDR